MALVVKNLPANARDVGSIPGLGRPPGGGHGNPLQYSCLENPMDRGARGAYSPESRTESDTTEVTAQLPFTLLAGSGSRLRVLILLTQCILFDIYSGFSDCMGRKAKSWT